MKPSLFFNSFFLIAIGFLTFAHAEDAAQPQQIHGARYGEIIVVTGGPFTFTGHVYNTIGLNDCPQDQWKALHPQELKKELEARAVILHGPNYFLMDQSWITHTGQITSFNGLQARFVADFIIPASTLLHKEASPYTENKTTKTTHCLFKKGSTIYELITPEGQRYVMQSYSQSVRPSLTEADLSSLGSHLSLPPGWQYQTSVLDHDLILQTNGITYALQDNFKNSYQRE